MPSVKPRSGFLSRNAQKPNSYCLKPTLERCGHGEAECLARLPQLIGRGKRITSELICVISRGAQREHAASDWNWSIHRRIQTQWVIRPVDTERRIDHGQEHLQLQPGRHSGRPVRPWHRMQVLREFLRGPANAVETNVESRTAEDGAIDQIVLGVVDLQLGGSEDRFHAHIDEWRQCHRTSDGNAVLQITDQAEIAAGEDDLVQRDRNSVSAL